MYTHSISVHFLNKQLFQFDGIPKEDCLRFILYLVSLFNGFYNVLIHRDYLSRIMHWVLSQFTCDTWSNQSILNFSSTVNTFIFNWTKMNLIIVFGFFSVVFASFSSQQPTGIQTVLFHIYIIYNLIMWCVLFRFNKYVFRFFFYFSQIFKRRNANRVWIQKLWPSLHLYWCEWKSANPSTKKLKFVKEN